MSLDWLYLYLLPFVVVLTIVVFVHELGHFLFARRNGVKVEVFSIGMGPEIFGFTDRVGTRWKFSAIPLGGYVKMFSDADMASRPDEKLLAELTPEERAYSHHHKTVWQRIQISAAGPLANYVFGIALLSVVYTIYGLPMPKEEPVIGFISSKGVAAQSGLKVGDKIVAIDNHQINTFKDIADFVSTHPSVELDVVIERDGQQQHIKVTPQATEEQTEEGNTVRPGRLGIGPEKTKVDQSFVQAVGNAFGEAWAISYGTLKTIGGIIIRTHSADGLSGPIGIAKITGDIATADLSTFLWFIAFLSINLGFINLLPVPMLDGGHLLFYIIEAVRGKPLSERTQENAFRVGMVLLLSLFLFTTYKDVERIHLVERIMSWFN